MLDARWRVYQTGDGHTVFTGRKSITEQGARRRLPGHRRRDEPGAGRSRQGDRPGRPGARTVQGLSPVPRAAAALAAVLLCFLPHLADAKQGDPRLDGLFARLKAATTQAEAAPVEAEIGPSRGEAPNPESGALLPAQRVPSSSATTPGRWTRSTRWSARRPTSPRPGTSGPRSATWSTTTAARSSTSSARSRSSRATSGRSRAWASSTSPSTTPRPPPAASRRRSPSTP